MMYRRFKKFSDIMGCGCSDSLEDRACPEVLDGLENPGIEAHSDSSLFKFVRHTCLLKALWRMRNA